MNNAPTTELTAKEVKDLKVLALFTEVYCRTHHDTEKSRLGPGHDFGHRALRKRQYCSECREFLLYAFERRIRCPLEPKPSCKHCRIHCYRPGHQEKVREIMRFSGRYLMSRGRFDLLWHYLF